MALSNVSSDVSWIMDTISSLWKTISNFFDSLWTIISYLWSIIEVIRYWFASLVSGAFNLVIEVLNWEAILNTARAFWKIAEYIWWPATVFLASLLIIIMLRIAIWFVWRILKMNDSYNMRKTNWAKWIEQTWEKHVSDSIDEFENWKRLFR